MSRIKNAHDGRLKRHRRIRQRVIGTSERLRLCVFRSVNHIYAQVVDDTRGITVAAASTMDPSIKEKAAAVSKIEGSKLVGALVAERAKDQGIAQVVFDRGGYRYHGRIQALAEAAREKGLEF